MAQRAESAADVTRRAGAFARAMTVGVRSWSFYPPDHPAVVMAVERLIATAADACAGGVMQLAVTPHALLIDGLPLEASDLGPVECAELLHDRDILQLSIVAPPSDTVVRSLLAVLSLDRITRRAGGGPAALWAAEQHSEFLIEQIDYQEILEREMDEGPTRRDATWKSIVRSIILGRTTFSTVEQERLLEISRHIVAIGELAKDAKEPYCMPDGSPMVTTQAAAVLAVYRHIAKTVKALEPQRLTEVVSSLALSTESIEPATTVELLMTEEPPDTSVPIVAEVKQSLDDQQVAGLLARALSSGAAMSRLSQVFETLAPDDQRKKRVLTLARRLIGQRDFGSKRPIDDIRKSLDELLLRYDETAFVSNEYRVSIDRAAARASEMAHNLPAEIGEWLETLGGDSVRRLSGQLLIDLLRTETKAARLADIAHDMAAFVEELLLAGAYGECVPVVEELAAALNRKPALAPEACREAIDTIGASSAMAESLAALGDQSDDELALFEQLIKTIGPGVVPAIIATYRHDKDIATERATRLIVALGPSAIPPIAAALDSASWLAQRELAVALGEIRGAAAIPPLQSLLRRGDVRVLQHAVASLCGIADPAAERALHTVLRATSGEARSIVIATLLNLKVPRVVPMLVRVLQDGDPFGGDYPLILETLTALGTLRDDRSVTAIATLAKRRRWLSWGRTTRTRRACLQALAAIGSAKARQSIDDLAKGGDYFLRRMAKAAARS